MRVCVRAWVGVARGGGGTQVTEVIPAADVEGPPLKGFDVLHVLERPPLPDPEEDEQA